MNWTRRRVVAATTGIGLAAGAGCLGDDDDGNGSENEPAESDDADDDRDAELEEYGDLEDYTGEDTVEVTVDPDDGFEPAAFEIDADTFVNWVWEGSSTNVYPIDIPDPCVWDENVDEGTVDDHGAGDEFDRLFWADGAYLYGSRDADGEEFTGAFRVLENEDEDDDEDDE